MIKFDVRNLVKLFFLIRNDKNIPSLLLHCVILVLAARQLVLLEVFKRSAFLAQIFFDFIEVLAFLASE